MRRFDVVLLSHAHADHCNALARLLERVPVGAFYDPGLPYPSAEYAELRAVLRAQRHPVHVARAGDTLDLGTGVSALLVAPTNTRMTLRRSLDRGPTEENSLPNDDSAALLLRYGATQLLLTADQEAAGLRDLLDWSQENQVSLAGQVFLVPHHGRSGQYCGPLLAAMHPAWLLASGGEKPLRPDAPANLLYTGDAGTIWVESDGQRVGVTSFLRPAHR